MTKTVEQLYTFLADEEDARVCKDITDDACLEVPGNFFRILAAQVLTKLGDALANTKTVLPWVMNSVGAPTFITGLLVPVRESGSLIPQLFLGGVIRRYGTRKWFFVIGCLLQAAAVAGIAATAYSLEKVTAGVAVITLLILFSLARGICSVSSKDVLGKTIPKTRRGRLSGYSASAAGLISVGAGGAFIISQGDQSAYYWVLLLAASICWVLASLCFSRIAEYPGATEGGGNAVKEALKSAGLLKDDRPFRQFVLVRSLMMSSGLSAPYVILLASQGNTELFSGLGPFIIASGIAGLVSGSVWGRFADRSSRAVMISTSALTAGICLAAAALAYFDTQITWLYVVVFFLLSVTHEGVRLGRKTYVIDLGKGNKRTDYVAVSNSFIGVMLLIVGFAGALLAQVSLVLVLTVFAVASGLAMIMGLKLKEVQ